VTTLIPSKSRVVVASPGAPEMLHMAEAFADARMLRAFIAPFAPTQAEIDSSPMNHLGPLGRGWLSQLRRRVVSDKVGRCDRFPAARAADMAATAALRLGVPAPVEDLLAEWRNRAIQHRVADLLDGSDTDLFVPAGAALEPLRRARRLGTRTWLDCPTAHHRYAKRLLDEERHLQPEFADTLQYPAPSRRAARALDREIEQADEFVLLSTFQRRSYEEEGVDPDHLHQVPLGVDLDVFRPLHKVRHNPFTVGFVGQVTQRKGISYLIDAFETLRPLDVRLLIVGRPVGPRRPWLREGVTHEAPVARRDLARVYSRMDVVVLPSLIEGFGLTALEAMACGVPVIVSEHTFGTDIVVDGENGFVVPIRDATAIAERIRKLVADEDLRAAMAANARSAAQAYSWSIYGSRIVELVTGNRPGD
jgi:glycosyltransferase involved in cell wall biosynthesis